MGRGRAKAKQVKVARQLKYGSGGTDLDRLRTELGVGRDERDAYGDQPHAGRHRDGPDDVADEDEADEDAEDAG